MFFNIGWDPVRPMVGVWWTLPVELSFYLLLPLIASFMRPGRWLGCSVLGGTLLSMLYRLWSADHFAAAPEGVVFLAASHLPGSLPEFLMGASAALLVQWFDLNAGKRQLPGCWMVLLPGGSHPGFVMVLESRAAKRQYLLVRALEHGDRTSCPWYGAVTDCYQSLLGKQDWQDICSRIQSSIFSA